MNYYRIKWLAELGWAVAIAIAVVVFTALVTFDPTQIGDWQAWAVGIGASVVRVVAATVLNEVRKNAM